MSPDVPAPAPALLNRTRVERVLGARGLDGLVAADPLHVHHLASLASSGTDPASHGPRFAVLPARDSQPAALVLDRSSLPALVADGGTWLPNVVVFATDDAAEWATRPGAMPTPHESQWLALRERAVPEAPMSALVRAVRDAGLEHATLGLDDARLAERLRASGLEHATFVVVPEAFRELRAVKSDAELGLLRTAARIVEIACLEAVAQVHEGAAWPEIENHFMAELAWRGGRGVRLGCGPAGLPSAAVRRGEPVAADALGRYRGYRAAFGRTAVVGAPSSELLRRNSAMQRGFADACERLRPGMRRDEFAASCADAVRAHGFPEFRRVRVATLGLDPLDAASPLDSPADAGAPLEAGEVVAVSLQYVEIGWGSALLTDSLLVGEHGAEALTTMQTDLLVAP